MKDVKIVLGKPFPSYVEISIYDIVDGKERRRAGITADYSEIDIKPYIKEGKTLDEVVQSYDEWLDNTLRRHLLDYCNIVSGHEEYLAVIREKIARYF